MAKSPKRGSRGPAPKPISKEQRDKVRLWAAGGIAEEQIAYLLKISRNTLRKRYPRELDQGNAIERARNLERLQAAADKGNVAAIKHLDAKLQAAAAQRAWTADEPDATQAAPAAQPGGKGKHSKKEAVVAAAEQALQPTGDWGSDLMPEGVLAFPVAAARKK